MPANIKITPAPNGQIDINVTCPKCNGPFIGSNKYGMYCKKRCFEKVNKAAYHKLVKLLGDI